MAINFPNNPINGNTYRYLNVSYIYSKNGTDEGYWKVALPIASGVASAAEIDAGVNAIKYISPLALETSKYLRGDPSDLLVTKEGTTTARALKSRIDGGVSILDFGAVADGTTDCFPAFQAALLLHRTVIVPAGDFYCSGMVEIGGLQAVVLMNGAQVVKYEAFTTNDEPVFWLKSNFSQLLGESYSGCRIISQRNSTDGVVLVGHRSMTESHANVNYCTVANLRISGKLPYGFTDTSVNSSLCVQNPQFKGLTSYFHTIENLILENNNVGLELRGWANGIIGGNIHGYRLGNTTAGVAAFVWVRGALDNAMSNFFFHQSSNSDGMIVEKLDNTANGGVVHSPVSSKYSGLVFEQGGAAARGLVILSSSNSYYESRHNVSGGNFYAEGILENNVVIGNKALSTGVVNADRLYSTSELNIDGVITKRKKGLIISEEYSFYLDTGLAENTAYKIVDINLLLINRSVVIEVDHVARLNNFGGGGGGGKVIYTISRGTGGALWEASANHRSGGSQPMSVGISGNIATLALLIPDNGTATVGHTLAGTIKILGRKDAIYTSTYYEDAVVTTGLSILPENVKP